MKFAELIDGKWVYRFANHPRFSYWAFNMIQRKQILQQSGISLKQNPGEAHLTIRGAHPHKIWGGELDCGDDFPKGVRATFCCCFFGGGGDREPIAQL